MTSKKTKKPAAGKGKGKPRERIASLRYEKLRAAYLASGDLTSAGKAAGYSDKYIHSAYSTLRDRLEADPVVQAARKQIQEKGIATAEEKRALLWSVAQAAATAIPVKDAEGIETGEYRLDARGAVAAITELNRMDGDHAEIQIKHKGKVGVGIALDPTEMTHEELDTEIADLLGKGETAGAVEGEETA